MITTLSCQRGIGNPLADHGTSPPGSMQIGAVPLLRFGQALGRKYSQYASDQKVDFAIPLVAFGDNRTQKNVNFGGGLIAELRLVYSVPIPGS